MINFSFPIEEIANFMAYISWLKNDTINKCENLHLYEETESKVTSIKNSSMYTNTKMMFVWKTCTSNKFYCHEIERGKENNSKTWIVPS
jgi:hypothetical protein